MSLILKMLGEVKNSGAEAKTTAAEKAQADKEWQFKADKTAFDTKVAMDAKMTSFTDGAEVHRRKGRQHGVAHHRHRGRSPQVKVGREGKHARYACANVAARCN